MIIVHCHFYLKENERMKEEIQVMVETTMKEKGCISYIFVKDILEEGHYLMIEKWETQEDLDIHSQQPHFARFVSYIKEVSIKTFHLEKFETK